ncbi:MAG: flavodoxin family protein [Candidatus Gastranaerophilales bacterium]|nr:flavodoxin family protein [Candidatus Gastranaerophilales bacterium]
MKISVLTGSPRKNGTSNYMADEFLRGAKEKGHEIYKFDTARADIKNCIACNACQMGSKPCIHKDDFVELKEHLVNSDVIVFVTPMYYFGMSSTLKKVIDRFYSIDPQLKAKQNKAVLISVQHAPVDAVKEPLNHHYQAIISWLNMENAGIINAIGIESVEHLKQTPYPNQAYELGKSI